MSLCCSAAVAQSRRTDNEILMQNGDRFVGEVRSMTHGELIVRLPYALNDLTIDWKKVKAIRSVQRFAVIDAKGHEHVGVLSVDGSDLTGVNGTQQHSLQRAAAMQIAPASAGIWPNLHGSVDVGYSGAGSGTSSSGSLQTTLRYESASAIGLLTSSTQAIAGDSSRSLESLVQAELYRHLGQTSWYSGVLASFLSSTQQQIDLRTDVGGGLGKRVVFTRTTNVDVGAGLVFTDQRASGVPDTKREQQSLDGVVNLSVSAHKFDVITFTTSAWLYPGLTDPERFRMNLSQSVDYKLKHGVFMRLSFYDYYANHATVGRHANSLGGVASAGWSFH